MASWIKVADVGDIPVGEARRIEVGGRAIALFHVDGEYYAIDDRCTHEEASLSEGWIEGHEIECPLHGARYDLKTGRATALPAVRSVAAHAVRVTGTDVLVEI